MPTLTSNPTMTRQQMADFIVAMPEYGDRLQFAAAELLKIADDPRLAHVPGGEAKYAEAAQQLRAAQSQYTRLTVMVKAAIQNGLRTNPSATLEDLWARWVTVNAGLSGAERVPFVTPFEALIIAGLVLSAVAFAALALPFVVTLGTLGTIITLLVAAIASIGATSTLVTSADIARTEANIKAIAAGIDPSPTITQIASKGLNVFFVLGLVAAGLYVFSQVRRSR